MQGKYTLSEILHAWKSYIAHKANKLLNRSGAFWFREYHDRFIRDPEHLAAAVKYVETNPVKARLVTKKEEWEWSSASKRGCVKVIF
jgi:REP element-mobilizing transposase RayT